MIISFSRSGAIAAGAIAINLNIQKVIVIPRVLKNHENDNSHEKRFHFEDSITLQPDYFKGKRVLIVAFSMFTSETIKSGIEFLKNNNITPREIKVTRISVSDGAVRAFPEVIYSVKSNRPERYLN